MPQEYQDSVGESGSLSGGTVTLSGALAGFRAFTAHTSGNTVPVRVIQLTDSEITKAANYTATYTTGSLALGAATSVSALGEPSSGTVEVYEVATAADLNKAVSALQSSDIGSSVQAYSAVLQATTASFTVSDETKLDGIEAGADVTDATNVDAAGAVMNTDTSTASMSFVVDEDDMSSDSATKIPTQQSVKAYVDNTNGGLSRVNSALTTGNLTATVNAHHILDISGMTADRDLVIPAGSSQGDVISFALETAAPADYELRLIGDTGVTLNLLGTDRAATADAMFRYFIAGEGARLTWDATDSKWLLDKQGDGRIPQKARYYLNSTVSSGATNNSWTDVDIDTENYDNASLLISGSPNYFAPRRAGYYQFIAQVRGQRVSGLTNDHKAKSAIWDRASNQLMPAPLFAREGYDQYADSSLAGTTIVESGDLGTTTGQYILRYYQATGFNIDVVGGTANTYAEMLEIL